MPTEKEIITETFTELAPRYERVVDQELKRFWGWSYDGFVEMLIKLTPIHETDKVLDVATGTAVIPLKLAHSHKSAKPITGLDITPAMLRRAKARTQTNQLSSSIHLVCASAMAMPFSSRSFDAIICGLATHHMDIEQLLSEMQRVLKEGGSLTIGDVGGSPTWRFPIIRLFIRVLAFVYFLAAENLSRAWAESSALSHIHTAEEWHAILSRLEFQNIKLQKLPSKHFWSPDPLVITTTKSFAEGINVNNT